MLSPAFAVDGFPIIARYAGSETGMHGKSFCAAQDADGVMYFGGTSLLTFDGDRWRQFGIGDSYVLRQMRFAPDGKLWFGGINDLGWFERDTGGNWAYRSLAQRVPQEHANFQDVFGVWCDRDSRVFITTDRILRWQDEKFSVWRMSTAFKLFPISIGSELLIHHLESGVYRLTASGPELVLSRQTLPTEDAIVWAERTSGGWLFLSSSGIFSSDGVKHAELAPAIAPFLRHGRVSCAARLRDGRLVIGTVNSGLAIVRPDGSVERFIGETEGLPSPNITSVYVTSADELWVTSGSHILRIDLDLKTVQFDTRTGVPPQTIHGITRYREHLLLKTEGGIFETQPESASFKRIPGLEGRHHHFTPTDRGVVVAMFRQAGLWDGLTTRTVYEKAGSMVATGFWPRTQEILIASPREVVAIDRDDNTRVLVHSLPATLTSLAVDATGTLWAGTLGRGVLHARLSTSAVGAIPPESSSALPKLVGATLTRVSADGTILVAADNGIWTAPPDAGRFTPLLDAPSRKIAALSEATPDGTWWIVYANAATLPPLVGRVSRRDGLFAFEPHSVPGLVAAGAPTSIFAEQDSPANTTLWIGGTESLLRHQVGAALHVPVPRPPVLRAFARLKNDQIVQIDDRALPHSTRWIRIELAAPEFSRRSLLRIETRLLGSENGWVPVEAGSVREFNAVREGIYSLQARVVAENGMASEAAVVRFEVLPPWWRTAPSYGAGVLALLGLGFATYRLRLRTLRRRNAELEEKVRLRTEELVAANAAKTQFVANMSHDIRNPLNGIVGLALALEDTRLDPRQREIVATLRECTSYLSTLVDDVLDFASIEAGRVELRPGPFSPGELLASIVTTLKADAIESGASLTCEFDPALPPHLVGDAGRIQQILVNFVSNALKYAGGSIQLTANAPLGAPGEVEFSVIDRGPGIAADEQATLFTKFTRLQSSRDAQIPGAGLGLAACRLLADLMGGSVGVVSEPGHGARFFLRLPLVVAGSAPQPDIGDLPSATVLLVEDADYNALAATAVLARLGLSCDRAHNGEEAVRMFGEKRYNVVLLDRNLPDIDGTEVARRIRNLESDGFQSLILAVTAYCTAEDRALCLAAGMDAFVGKPLTPEKLRRVLLAAARKLLASATVDVPREPATTELDLSLLNYLSDGTDDGFALQVRRFLETLVEAQANLTTALRTGQFETLALEAHRLLGQARMIGGAGLGEAASQLEESARLHDGAACHSALARVAEEIRAVTEAMRRRPQPMSTT